MILCTCRTPHLLRLTNRMVTGETMKEKESLYDWLVNRDIVEWVKPLILQAGWYWREDGKLAAQMMPGIYDTPWHHVKSDWRLKCGLWHQIMFDLVGQVLPSGKRFVPSKCQNCFKVVVRPQNLVQLFALKDVQITLDRPCKCGIERRETVHGLYGGYFYNVGLEEGLECYKIVREAISINKYLGEDVPVILKRGCTEYEHAVGDSDEWEITDEQRMIEGLLDRWLVVDDIEHKQAEKLIHHVHRKWIEWAYAMGDPTYSQFTGGKPLYPPYKTYEHMLE